MIYMQPLIYDVLQTEGDFYLGNQEPKQLGNQGGDDLSLKHPRRKSMMQEGSREINTQMGNRELRPKSKRAKRGKRSKPILNK